VPQHLHDCPWLDALSEQERRTGVPQIVEAQPGQTSRRAKLVEGTVDIPRFQRCADGRSEDQPVVPPHLSDRQALRRLPSALPFERGHGRRGDRQRSTGSVRLRLHEPELAAHSLYRPPDPQRPLLQIDVGPPQTQDLTAAKAHRQRHHEYRLQPMLARDF
jgi:hypothetical protein